MEKLNLEKYRQKIFKVLGNVKINNLHKLQVQSLNNQLYDLLEEHNHVIDKITRDEIIGRYDLVTKYIYPDDLLEII